jgi:hypothetical protein
LGAGDVVCQTCGYNPLTGAHMEVRRAGPSIDLKPILGPVVAIAILAGSYFFFKDSVLAILNSTIETQDGSEGQDRGKRRPPPGYTVAKDLEDAKRNRPPPKVYGEFTFAMPSKEWQKIDHNAIFRPLKNKRDSKAHISLMPYREYTFKKIHGRIMGIHEKKLRVSGLKFGPLTAAKHKEGAAKKFRLDYSNPYGKYTHLFILIERKEMILQLELQVTTEEVSEVEPEFLKVVESVQFDF